MKKEKRKLTEAEKDIVRKLSHPLYTVDFLEEWINRNDNVSINAVAALQACYAKGFYEAVQLIAKKRIWSRR